MKKSFKKLTIAILLLVTTGCAGLQDSEVKLCERFEIWHGAGTKPVLVDTKSDFIRNVIADISRYQFLNGKFYVIGYYSSNNFPDRYYDIKEKETKKRESQESIERYIILDIKNEELVAYESLDEVPENEKVYFTEELSYWCLPQWSNETCYIRKEINK